MSDLTREQKIDYITFAVSDLLGQATNGALIFDVAFDENFEGKSSHVEGKAFTTDGINFFGYAEDERYPGRNFDFSNDRIFAGTYVDGKGMSILTLPFSNILLEEIADDLVLNATNRPNDEYMHGKYPMGLTRVKADLVENATGDDVTKVFRTFFEMLAYMTKEYPDLAYDLIQNGYNGNVSYIEKLYEKFKNIPIPSCFEGNGSTGPSK